jgi:TolB-like protein
LNDKRRPPSAPAFRFGEYEFDPKTGELSRAGDIIRLAPQQCRVLTALVSRAGEVIFRDDLRDEIWPSDTFVDFDLGLNHCVNRLRAALGDDAHSARFIETVRKRGYRFVAPVQPTLRRRERAVAVLSFENLNRQPQEDYLADGVTDMLIEALARMRELRVISRQSVQHVKGSVLPLCDIARALDVDAVVEGSTLRAGARARVAGRLVQAEPERSLWAGSYEGALDDVLAFMGEVVASFAAAIGQALTGSPVVQGARV